MEKLREPEKTLMLAAIEQPRSKKTFIEAEVAT